MCRFLLQHMYSIQILFLVINALEDVSFQPSSIKLPVGLRNSIVSTYQNTLHVIGGYSQDDNVTNTAYSTSTLSINDLTNTNITFHLNDRYKHPTLTLSSDYQSYVTLNNTLYILQSYEGYEKLIVYDMENKLFVPIYPFYEYYLSIYIEKEYSCPQSFDETYPINPITTTTTTTTYPIVPCANNIICSGQINCGDILTGSLNSESDIHYYYFNSSGLTVLFDSCGSLFDTILYLFDMELNILYQEDDNNCCLQAQLLASQLQPGEYILGISGCCDRLNHKYGAWTMEVICTDTPITTIYPSPTCNTYPTYEPYSTYSPYETNPRCMGTPQADCVFTDSSHIFILSQHPGNKNAITLFKYDTIINVWLQLIDIFVSSPRTKMGCVLNNGFVYLFGGLYFTTSTTESNIIEKCSITNGLCIKIGSMKYRRSHLQIKSIQIKKHIEITQE
eukprot:461061_1